jgi:hypothetical protein
MQQDAARLPGRHRREANGTNRREPRLAQQPTEGAAVEQDHMAWISRLAPLALAQPGVQALAVGCGQEQQTARSKPVVESAQDWERSSEMLDHLDRDHEVEGTPLDAN